MENQTAVNSKDLQQLNNTPVGQNSIPNEKTALFWPVLITLLVSAVVFGTSGYFLGMQSNQERLVKQENSRNASQRSTLIPESIEDTNQVSSLPAGWTYQSNGNCNVEFAVPPKAEPYYYPVDPSRPPSVTGDQGSGRSWNFPRGGSYPNLLSKLPNWSVSQSSENRAAAMFVSSDEASGYVSQSVSVNCMPNYGQYASNTELFTTLNKRLSEYNISTEEKMMQSATYSIKENVPTQRWGYDVLDLIVAEESSDEEYTLFITSEMIYEVRILGGSEELFVKQTAQLIFENLRFQAE